MAAVKSSVKQVRYVMGAMTAVFFGSCRDRKSVV